MSSGILGENRRIHQHRAGEGRAHGGRGNPTAHLHDLGESVPIDATADRCPLGAVAEHRRGDVDPAAPQGGDGVDEVLGTLARYETTHEDDVGLVAVPPAVGRCRFDRVVEDPRASSRQPLHETDDALGDTDDLVGAAKHESADRPIDQPARQRDHRRRRHDVTAAVLGVHDRDARPARRAETDPRHREEPRVHRHHVDALLGQQSPQATSRAQRREPEHVAHAEPLWQTDHPHAFFDVRAHGATAHRDDDGRMSRALQRDDETVDVRLDPSDARWEVVDGEGESHLSNLMHLGGALRPIRVHAGSVDSIDLFAV